MRAIVAREPGGPEVLEWREVPDPEARAGEVLVRVVATAVNRADLLQRQGFYPPSPGASPVLGLECAGEVVGVGPGVTSVAPGAPVSALLSGGGYAELVAVPVGQLMDVPLGVPIEQAAALPEAACTVWSNLVGVAGLRPGQWLLVHGGASGIGTMAIQVARAIGARVAVTAGSPERLERCAGLGAEVLIDYHAEDFVAAVQAATGGSGADVILDNMGAAYLARNVSALARNGRLVVIGLQGGVRAELDLNALLRRNGTVHATSLRGRPLEEKAEVCTAVQRHVWPWVAAGEVSPVIDHVLPVQEAAEAHRRLAAGGVVGKIVLSVSPAP